MLNTLTRPFRENIQWRLTAYLLILVLVAMAVLLVRIYPEWRGEIIDSIEVGESSYVQSKQLQLQAFVDTLDQDIRYLAESENVQTLAQAMNDPNASTESIEVLRQAVEHDFFAFSDTRRIYNQVRYLDADGNEMVRIDFDGEDVDIRDQSDLANKSDRGYFMATAAQPPNQVYVSRLELNREGSPPTIEGSLSRGTVIPVIRYGIPIYVEDEDGEDLLVGTVITNVYAQYLLDLVVPNNDDAESFLIDQEGYYLVNTADPTRAFGFEPDIEQIGGVADARVQDDFADGVYSEFFVNVAIGNAETDNDQLIHFSRIRPPGADYYWVVGNVRDQSVLFDRVTDATTTTVLAVLGILLIIGTVGMILARRFTVPLVRLKQTAHAIADGDLSLRAPYSDRIDEIGELSTAFNAMTDRLDTIVKELEGRIQESTRDLQALVDVNIQTATLLRRDRLLEAVVNLAKDRFGLYHAHIYLLENQTLVLKAGAGYVGRNMVSRGHSIPFNSPRSIVAKAANERVSVIENDTDASDNYLRNALLPDTASEIAIPLISRGELLGVLDMQSDELGRFTARFVSILEVLAAQIANALSNAQLYEDTSRISRHEQALNQIAESIQLATSMDDILQTAVRELGKALRVPHTAIEVHLRDQVNGSSGKS